MQSILQRLCHRSIRRAVIGGIILTLAVWARAQDSPALSKLFALPIRPIESLAPLVNPYQLYSYERLLADAQQLAQTYPGLIEVTDIGHSVFGRRIVALRLGHGPCEITLNGAHHGREWVTSVLIMHMLDRYAQAYYRGELLDGYDVYALLNRVTIWTVPMVNPDGVALVQFGASSAPQPGRVIALNHGSHNFAAWKANGRGVDLNRQYPARWEEIDAPAPAPGAMNYRGSAPLTEPESQAMATFTQQHHFLLHVALHSAGDIIYWHFYQRDALSSDSERIAQRLHCLTGYSLVPRRDYESGGGYKDWILQTQGMPAYTIEVGRYILHGALHSSVYSPIWARQQTLGLFLAQEAVTPGRTNGAARGFLDSRLVAVADCPDALRDDLMRRVQQGEGSFAAIVRAGESQACWRYPGKTVYRVIVEGQTVAVESEWQAAADALVQALTAQKAAGGYVVTHMRQLVCAKGDGAVHAITLVPKRAVMQVDGINVALPAPPCELQGRFYVPLALFQAMGASMTFDSTLHAVILKRGSTHLILPLASALALWNDTPLRLQGPVFAGAGNTAMAPLGSIAPALGGCVTYDAKTGAISLRWYSAPPVN